MRDAVRLVFDEADDIELVGEVGNGRDLLPLLSQYLSDSEWTAVTRAATTTLSGREQMLVLGLVLEDSCALDRARLVAGLSPSARTAWRVVGQRNFRAAVVRLRGAPPAL